MFKIIKREKIFFAVVIIVYLAVVAVLELSYRYERDRYLDRKMERTEGTLHSVIYAYRNFSELIFETLIDKEEIMSLVANAWNSESYSERSHYRQTLLQKMLPTYEKIKTRGFSQVQFHFPDCVSFLRLYQPDIYGDDLSSIRDTVYLANLRKELNEGFEEGRTFNGYRFVFPLFLHGKHIGSVENSISLTSLAEQIENITGEQIEFILPYELATRKLYYSYINELEPFCISDDYLINKIFLEKRTSREEKEKLMKIRSAICSRAEKKMKKHTSFQIPLEVADVSYIVTFLNIENIMNKHQGYFIFYDRDSSIKSLHNIFIARALFVTAVLVILLLMIYERAKYTGKLENMAYTDPLTGVFNRRKFEESASNAFELSLRHGDTLSFILFDIDRFKDLNDSRGHSVGDRALEVISRACMEVIRRTDIIARWGGDEFIIMLPRTSHKGAFKLAERIQKRVGKVGQKEDLSLTLSMGITETRKTDTKMDDVFARADEALYRAKEKGRNRVETTL